LFLAEIGYRKVNFLLSLAAVVLAVTLFVSAPMLVEAYQQETQSQVDEWQSRVGELEDQVTAMRSGIGKIEKETAAELARLEDETRRLMRDMGFNLMITHRGTNMSDFWASDFAAADMPQEYVDRLAADRRLTMVNHLVATLQQRIAWENRKVLLVGYLPETLQPHSLEGRPMGYQIKPGTALLGHELGVGKKPGQTIKVLDRELRIARILPEQGSKEDITIAVHLDDAQKMLNKSKRINQIMALECRCSSSDLPKVRKQTERDPPRHSDHRVPLDRRGPGRAAGPGPGETAADRRRHAGQPSRAERILGQRKEILAGMEASRGRVQRILETLTEVLTPLVVLVSAIWLGLLAMANVRQRRSEIGLLRPSQGLGMIGSLLMGKAVLLGLLEARPGCPRHAPGPLAGAPGAGRPADYFALRGDVFLYAILGRRWSPWSPATCRCSWP